MPRSEKGSYELSEADQRDLFTLIREGRPLPEKYRFILFKDKREVELVWNGKTRDVCTTVLPFQTLEHIDEPRSETKTQEDLFDSRGRQLRGWTNKLIWGDNKLILSSLKSGSLRHQIEEAGGLKLIYIDPPFDVGADFSMDIEIGGEIFHKDANLLEQIAYRDTWGRGADSFIAMIYERIILMRDLMANDGAAYIHCDWKTSGFIRCILDEIFGKENFRNEIIWHYPGREMHITTKFNCKHDTIFFYAHGDKNVLNMDQIATPYDREDRLLGMRRKVHTDPDGREWVWETRGQASGQEPYKRYVDEIISQGKALNDVWSDLQFLRGNHPERVAYPTQKPAALMERIIKASSNEGDLVADFFIGSGTMAAVAEKLGRKWIATDLGKFAIHTTRKRLINPNFLLQFYITH